MTKYDPKLAEFTEKLAALMAEYGATIEVTDECRNWETYATGVSIEVAGSGEYEGQRFTDIEVVYINHSDIKLEDK